MFSHELQTRVSKDGLKICNVGNNYVQIEHLFKQKTDQTGQRVPDSNNVEEKIDEGFGDVEEEEDVEALEVELRPQEGQQREIWPHELWPCWTGPDEEVTYCDAAADDNNNNNNRCFLSAGVPATSPSKSGVVEAICLHLCSWHSLPQLSATRQSGRRRYISRWRLIVSDYTSIMLRLLNSQALLEGTNPDPLQH